MRVIQASPRCSAKISTFAPQAASSSAFQAQASEPPAIITRCAASDQKTGSLASGAMRAGARSATSFGSVCNTGIDDPPDFGAARTAIGAGLEFVANRFDAAAAGADGGDDLVDSDAE